jgi:hypothetical protein
MDKATQDEVRLRKGSSLRERLVRAGSGVLVLLIAAPGLVAWATGGPALNLAAFSALPLGCFLICVAALERNVAWIITPNGILIGEQRALGQLRRTLVRGDDIADIQVRRNRIAYPASFSLACRLASGDLLISPPLPDITRVNETSAAVARLLGLPATPVDNPLDAANPEIHLGRQVGPGIGRVVGMAVPLLAALCALPFIVALWMGERDFALGLALPLGLIAAFALYRNAHRLTGAFWVIRPGEIHIERIAWNGRPSAQTIRRGDIEAIDVDRRGSKYRTFTIRIRLCNGRTLRSPTSHDEDQARALRAEIIRRLGLRPPAN